jgi:hypothetical protein
MTFVDNVEFCYTGLIRYTNNNYTEKIICGIVGFFLTCIRFFLYSYHCTYNGILLVILCCRVGVFLSYDRFLLYSKNSHNAQVKFLFPKKSCTIRILLRFWNYSTYFSRQNKNQKKNIIHKFQLRFISV